MPKQQTRHPDLQSEQRYVDETYDHVEGLIERMQRNSAPVATVGSARHVHRSRMERLSSLEDLLTSDELLCFGRLDYEVGQSPDEQPRHYIGRVHILDRAGDPLVVSWKSDVAQPFYQATRTANCGIARRRSLRGQERLLTELADEILGSLPPHLEGADEWATPQDLLLADLERSRDGQMRDIVATIQGDQDRLIRADLGTPLVVQGGPGTGKTAVGLHRASYLLYRYAEELDEDSVLVVAPNTVFLRYIGQVLPGLGDEAVRHATVNSLGPQLETTRKETVEALRVKGDARMAELIRRYLDSRLGLDEKETQPIPVGGGRYQLTPGLVNSLVESARSSARTFNGGRQALRNAIVSHLAREHRRHGDDLRGELGRDSELDTLMDRAWPPLSPQQVVSDILTGPRRLKAAAEGLLTDPEREAISLPSVDRLEDMTWSAADVALVDEAGAQLDGSSATYRHLIIDEAQDLAPMQLRMLARRCPSKSMTVLGDLAQGTSRSSPRTWREIVEHLGIHDHTFEELTVGYRVPSEIISEANGLLPRMDVDVPETHSVRSTGIPPQYERLDGDDLLDELAAQLRSAVADREHSTGVIVPDELYDDVRGALQHAHVKYGEAVRNDLSHRVTLVPASLAKGLEFDHVLVIDGGVASQGDDLDARQLYVAMTRAVQELTVLEVPRPKPQEKATVRHDSDHDEADYDGVAHEVPALRFQQDGVTLYVTSLPARVIADVGVVDTWDPSLPEDSPEQGYQRDVVRSHAKQIAKFLLDPAHSRLMPTAATLSARRRLEFSPIAHNGEENSFGTLRLTRPIYIVDGQHRSAGFTLAAQEDEEVAAFERPVVILEAVPKLEEVRQFQTINATAKRVRTDLADRLLKQLGEFDEPAKSWKAMALDITDILNSTPRGAWHRRVTLPNGERGIATQRTMTESLKPVINGVLRRTDANTIAGALNNFWDALRRLMPEAFNEPKSYVLQKSNGVFAWHEVAAEVFLRCYADGKDFTEQRMFELLRETGEYVDPSFWYSRSKGGTAPNYGGRGGFSALAQEIIAVLPAPQTGGASGITL